MSLFVTLYLVGFARTLLVIAIIYFGIRIISRYVLPLLLDKGVKKMQEKMQDQYRQQQQQPSRPEGEVTVERKTSKKKENNNSGEYVDFEEVD